MRQEGERPCRPIIANRFSCLAGSVLIVGAFLGCQDARVSGGGGAPAAGGSVPGPGGGAQPGGQVPGLSLPDAGPAGGGMPAPTPPGPGDRCAEEAHSAQIVPLDLLLLVDSSGSMNEMVATRTKWAAGHRRAPGVRQGPQVGGHGAGAAVLPVPSRRQDVQLRRRLRPHGLAPELLVSRQPRLCGPGRHRGQRPIVRPDGGVPVSGQGLQAPRALHARAVSIA